MPIPVIVVAIILVWIFAARALRIIRPFEKGLVERLGKYHSTEDSGLTLIVPIIDTLRKVDMREQVIDVPPQDVITKDNAMVTVDAVIYFQIIDPFKVVYNVAQFQMAALKLAQTNLRNVVGDLELDQTLTSREKINGQLRLVLDEATDKWGVKVTRVELQKIDPPKDITDAMSRQMKAERLKRAAILEAEGLKQAQILNAEGFREKQAIEADGYKKKQVIEAEGKAQAIKTVADAEKYQIETVYKAIHEGNPTKDLLTIKYFEALANVANGQATKLFMPLELSGFLSSVAAIADVMKNGKKE